MTFVPKISRSIIKLFHQMNLLLDNVSAAPKRRYMSSSANIGTTGILF